VSEHKRRDPAGGRRVSEHKRRDPAGGPRVPPVQDTNQRSEQVA
jgi:hypothetical protein